MIEEVCDTLFLNFHTNFKELSIQHFLSVPLDQSHNQFSSNFNSTFGHTQIKTTAQNLIVRTQRLGTLQFQVAKVFWSHLIDLDV